jgi:hypothetical protein
MLNFDFFFLFILRSPEEAQDRIGATSGLGDKRQACGGVRKGKEVI